MEALGNPVQTEDLTEYAEQDFTLRDGEGREWPLQSYLYRGISFDAAAGTFSSDETQPDFDLIFLLEDAEPGALNGGRLLIAMDETTRGVIKLHEIPSETPVAEEPDVIDETPAVETETNSGDKAVENPTFMLDGFPYTICAIDDDSDAYQATMRDGVHGHAVYFMLPPDAENYADSEINLLLNAVVIEPSGNRVYSYANGQDDSNPYVLYYGLSNGILLEYCLMTIDSDDGPQIISLSDVVNNLPEPSEIPAAEPSEKPAAEPSEKPAAEPSEKPAAEPSEIPVAEPSEIPVAEPSEKPIEEPVVETTDEQTESGVNGLDLSVYASGDTVEGLLRCAEWALSDGWDAGTVSEALSAYAAENGLLQSLLYCGENIAAADSTETLVMKNACVGETFDYSLDVDDFFDYAVLDSTGLTVYNELVTSDAVKALFADENAQFCLRPYFWPESAFRRVFGTSFSKFKPAAPRAGYVCVVLDGESQTAPDSDWYSGCDDDYTLRVEMKYIVRSLLRDMGSEAPVLTGNPNLADQFWVFTLKYPFHAWYGSNNKKEVKGFNCVESLKVIDAKTHKTIGEVSAKNTLGRTIYEWHNWIAQADEPDLTQQSTYSSLRKKVQAAIDKQRSLAEAESPITRLNAQSALNGKLYSLAEAATDVWQKAIYAAGAKDVSLEDNELRFTLRGFDLNADLAADTDDPLSTMLESAAAYNKPYTLQVENGQIVSKDLKALKESVKKAAAAAKTAFIKKSFQSAVTGLLFPAVTEGTAKSAEELQPSDEFLSSLPVRVSEQNPDALAALFYAQASQKLSVTDGPQAMTLTCKGIDPETLLSEAAEQLIGAVVYQPAEERPTYADVEAAYLAALKDTAIAARKSTKNSFTFTFSVDDLASGTLPEAYADWLSRFRYAEALSELTDRLSNLPDIAALPYPASKAIYTEKSGTSVTIKLPKDADYTYVQLRKASTGELAASAFVHPGKSATMKVPKNDYVILWCSGKYWYGEELFFGYDTVFQKSETTTINSACSFTLTPSKDGDIDIYDADAEDFK